MTDRWDETWHRLREWTSGQAPSERLAAQILLRDGFTDLDPSHPLGGKDGGKDAMCRKDGLLWVMAVYFPRGQQPFLTIERKFREDLQGVAANNGQGFAFVTNQEVMLAERKKLTEDAGALPVELYHLERITAILDKPAMGSVRKQFLSIDFPENIPIDDAEKKRLWVGCSTLPSLTTEGEVRSNLSPFVKTGFNGEVTCINKRPDSIPEGTRVYHYVVAEGVPNACTGVDVLGNLENVGNVSIDGASYSVFRSEYLMSGDKGIIWKRTYITDG